MNKVIQNKRRQYAISLVVLLVLQVCTPTSIVALTSGPSQPEFSGFNAIGSSDMVDLFTGDLNYSIPLLELPGPGGSYPFILSYQSGITMDQEASWVGLGWSLNAGSIARQMRGIPDEFNGDTVTTIHDMKPNVTWDFGIGADVELFAIPLNDDGSSGIDSLQVGAVSLGHTFSHNSYRGWDAGLNMGLNITPFNTAGYGFNAGLSTSAIEGATVSAGFSYENEKSSRINSFNFGTTLNSRQGLTNLNLEYGKSFGGNISFEKQSFIPANHVRYTGFTFDGSVEIGGLIGLAHLGGRVNVGNSTQFIQNRRKPVRFNAYGYLNAKEQKKHSTFIADINRSNESALHRYTENLAIPATTPDVFNIMGSTMSTSFRAYRSDVGIYSDPNISSRFGAANLGFDINLGAYVDVGLNIGARYVSSSNTNWPVSGKDISNFKFTSDSLNTHYKSTYFKIPGELSSDSINSHDHILKDKTVRIRLNGVDIENSSKLETERGAIQGIEKGSRSSRKATATSIQYVLNKELNSEIGLTRTEYAVWIHNPSRILLDRSFDNSNHIGGFEIVNPEGMRYIYGLPIKNKEHREHLFTVSKPGNECSSNVQVQVDGSVVDYKQPNTDEFYQLKELPEYNHTHLLTAVLGEDYADIDDTVGLSDGDLGFWVRLEYEKVTDFAWRAPYDSASYIPSHRLSKRDDKGSFMYGVREQYYLKSAETRTHRIVFITSTKNDGEGATGEFVGSSTPIGVSRKLDEILLFSKLDVSQDPVNALKRIKFAYNESLCDQIPNGSQGKTTLKKLSFSYERSIKGLSTPYEFEYSEINPDYSFGNQDRWGRFQEATNGCYAQEYPYSRQDSIEANVNAEAWTLKKIKLPSGAEISITYEADEYMYVQDKEAMQMFQITRVSNGSDPNHIENPKIGPHRVFFDPGDYEINNPTDMIPFLKNIHGLHIDAEGNILNSAESQVYFKVNMDILHDTLRDYVSGYARLMSYGIDNGEPYIELAPMQLSGKEYHPFCAASWQKMKIEYPQAISLAQFEDDNQTFMEVIGLFAASINEISSSFRSFFSTCNLRGYATHINPELSVIRLSYPGTGKIGGNSRVRQISLDDKWNTHVTLGQIYDYDMINEEGQKISSGVAENEPSIGYEESPLRYANLYNKQIPVHTSENLMFEFPINENYLPAANIGYRHVTVRSLASSLQKEGESGLPENFGTTGRTVYEYYTAKDFPVIYEQTSLQKHFPAKPPFNPIFSLIQRQSYAGSQGYSITLNDMHGKPYRITHFGEDKLNRESESFTTRTVYTYFENEMGVSQELGKYRKYRTLQNDLMAFMDYAPHPNLNTSFHLEKVEFGVDREFFTDLRLSNTRGSSYHIGPNIVFSPLVSAFLPIPVFGSFVNVSISESKTKTAVTNKIISKSGIVKQVDIYDGQSHLRTNNLVFDKITGNPVLTSVNNAFDEKIYSLNLPAHYMYDGMNAAYNNYRVHLTGSINGIEDCNGWYKLENVEQKMQPLLKEDDELLILQDEEVVGTLIVQEKESDNIYCSSTLEILSGDYTFLIIRSGARNMISQGAFQLTSKTNPLTNITVSSEHTFDVNTFGGPEQSSFIPIHCDSVISANVTTYNRIVSPSMEIETFCACPSVLITCDGDCYGTVIFAYTNNVGDTIVLDESECFDCHENSGDTIQINFDCIENLLTSWEFIAYIVPVQEPCTEEEVFNLCSGEIESLSSIEFNPCPTGARPGLEMNPAGNKESLISMAGGNHWIPKSELLYDDSRLITTMDRESELDLRNEGLINSVYFYNFNHPFFNKSALGSNWVEKEYVFGTVDNNYLRTENSIGIPTTHLKGFPNKISYALYGNPIILSASNALPSEVAFESFDDLIWSVVAPPSYLISGNFNFDKFNTFYRKEDYRLVGGISGTPTDVLIAKQFDENDELPDYIVLKLKDDSGDDQRIFINSINSQAEFTILDYDSKMIVPYKKGTRYNFVWPLDCAPLEEISGGEVTLVYENTQFFNELHYVQNNDYAHTGSGCLEVIASQFDPRNQYLLNLIKGKKYVFEGWIRVIHSAYSNVPTYPDQWYVKIQDGSNFYDVKPRGEIIEGWQQIYCTFTASGGPISTVFRVSPETLFDDIRISPLDALVKTYVYDPHKLRLIAELDENNYATFYHYDEEGELVLIRKETEKGIMTVNEVRTNMHQ